MILCESCCSSSGWQALEAPRLCETTVAAIWNGHFFAGAILLKSTVTQPNTRRGVRCHSLSPRAFEGDVFNGKFTCRLRTKTGQTESEVASHRQRGCR